MTKLDDMTTPASFLEFHVVTIDRTDVPVTLVVEGRVTFGQERAGSATIVIRAPQAFESLAVGHTYRLVEVR